MSVKTADTAAESELLAPLPLLPAAPEPAPDLAAMANALDACMPLADIDRLIGELRALGAGQLSTADSPEATS